MPYVLLVPVYWFDPSKDNIQRCANHWAAVEGAKEASFGACVGHKIGAMIGRPLNYEATTTVPRDASGEQRFRTVEPIVYVGLTFSPNVFISLGAGLTFATLRSVDSDTNLEKSKNAALPTLALGLNLDILQALFRK